MEQVWEAGNATSLQMYLAHNHDHQSKDSQKLTTQAFQQSLTFPEVH